MRRFICFGGQCSARNSACCLRAAGLSAHAQNPTAKPFAIVAQTVKGWGVASVVGKNAHGRPVTEEEKAKASEALDALVQRLGATWTAGDLQRPALPTTTVPPLPPVQRIPSFHEALQRFGHEPMLDQGTMAARNGAYTLTQMHVHRIPKSGRTPDDVLRALQLSASDIAQTAVKMLDVATR